MFMMIFRNYLILYRILMILTIEFKILCKICLNNFLDKFQIMIFIMIANNTYVLHKKKIC